jgi:protease-4
MVFRIAIHRLALYVRFELKEFDIRPIFLRSSRFSSLRSRFMIRYLIAASLVLGLSIARADNIPNKPTPVDPGKPVPFTPGSVPPVAPPKPDKPLPKPDKPTTKPVLPDKKAAPTTNASAAAEAEHYPTPAELMAKINAKKAEVDKLLKVAHFDLSSPLVEKSPEFTLFGDSQIITIQNLVDRLHRARDDKGLRAVLVTFSADTEFNMAQAGEIRSALDELRKAGKRTFAYADGYDTATYLAASGATDVCLLQGGEIMIPGVGIETMFTKGLMDKVGVKADYVQIGEYKGADEQYTRTEPSPESRGELNKVVESLYGVIVDTIARNRNISKTSVKQIIDDCIITAKEAKDRKLIDHLLSQDELRDLMTDELGGDINILPNYAEPEHEKLDFSNPFTMLANLGKKPRETSNKSAIALIHANGVIVDGEAEDGIMGASGNVGSENIRKAFRMASRDDNVKAIVLRIDSPGGSALASEVMWQAVNAAAQDKPVIVSVGSMAASGGYYLASASDYIFADPSAIVGSIGVVGGKFVLKDLFDKLGITTETFSRGKNSGLFSMNTEWTDRQRRMVTNWMKQTYDQFTERVMTNRKDKIKDIDQVARGRIFLARQAKEIGLIDEIGGLTDALAYAASEAGLKENDYEVKSLPGSRSLIDMISGKGGGDSGDLDSRLPFKAKFELSVDSPLKMMPASVRRAFGQQIQMMQLLDKRPIMLVSPYTVTLK